MSSQSIDEKPCVLCNETRAYGHELCPPHTATYYWIADKLELSCNDQDFLANTYRDICDGSKMIYEDDDIARLDGLADKELIKIDRKQGWYITLLPDGKEVARFVILEDSK